MFNLASGIALLVASALAGVLWDRVSPAATFYTGAALIALCAVAIVSMNLRGQGPATRAS